MRKWPVLFALIASTSCGSGEGEDPETVSTRLSGEVFLGGEPHFMVEVFRVGAEGEEQIAGRAEAEDGVFEVDLGFRSGTFLIRATNDGGEQILGYAEVELDERREVFLTPVTHLSAVLASRSEGDPAVRVEEAEDLVNGHFLGLSHGPLRPVDVRREPAVSLSDDVAAGFLLAAFEELARSWAGDETLGLVSPGRLLDGLSADLSADGKFDEMGERGRPLVVAGRAVDGVTLRADLGRALLRFAESAENATAFERADVQPMAEALANSGSPLFVEGDPEALDDEGPVFRRWYFARNGTRIDSTRPLSGPVELLVETEDASQVERIWLAATEAEVRGAAQASFTLDTTALPDGRQEAELVAVDAEGNMSRLVVMFEVDNAPPLLEVEDPGRLSAGNVTLTGTVSDGGSPVEVVRALVAGMEIARVDGANGPFSLNLEVPCGRRLGVTVEAVDRAGNVSEVRREILCDAAPPVIEVLPTVFIQERSLRAVHRSDGTGIEYEPVAAGLEQMAIDASTAWPIRVSKYLNRLDDLDALGNRGGGENIPKIRLSATELSGQPVASEWDALFVEYRYLVDGTEVRPFTALFPMGGLPVYEVGISYQDLGPELGVFGPNAEHEVEVRVTDEAGQSVTRSFPFYVDLHSPPVRFSGCGISPVLSSFQLSSNNMRALFETLPETEATFGTVRYPLHLPPESEAPSVQARLSFTAPAAETRATEFREDVHYAAAGHYANTETPDWICAPGFHFEVEMPRDRYLGCFFGSMPADRTLLQSPAGLNDGEVHSTRVTLFQGPFEVSPEADGSYVLDPNVTARVRGMLVAPRVRFGGTTYDFRQTFNLPNGYEVGPYPARYRVDAPFHRGVEFPPYGSLLDPNRAFVTRPYLYALEIEVGPVGVLAEIEGRPDVEVGVQVEPECLEAHIHQTTAN